MKHLHVACALIENGANLLCTQRSATMSMPHKWEFPGGKLDDGETPEACLIRECNEELGVIVEIKRPGPLCRHRYPGFDITLYPFTAEIISGEIVLAEHAAVLWLPPDQLLSLDWAAADVEVVEWYLALHL